MQSGLQTSESNLSTVGAQAQAIEVHGEFGFRTWHGPEDVSCHRRAGKDVATLLRMNKYNSDTPGPPIPEGSKQPQFRFLRPNVEANYPV